MTVPAAEFDVLGPLPSGTVVLEASAGTGKTFTIAALVARYLAEGVATVDELLVMTFGRSATAELRERVRARLVQARDALADPASARAHGDEVVRHLARGTTADVHVRQTRLAAAVRDFDAATVVTTHQFCEQVLVGLGTAADVDADARLVDGLDDLLGDVVEDLYLRKWGVEPGDARVAAPIPVAEARHLAGTVVGDPQALLVPPVGDDAPGSADAPPAVRVRFAAAVRAEVDARKRRARVLGFDDLLSRLRDTLADPRTGPSATARLRRRYRIVLVDEFQDTDPVQWDIVRRAFHGAATLVLIGDPKQAIYAFRGADVVAYLDAVGVADVHATLARNWRSDPDLLRGLDALFRGAALGDDRIRVSAVHPAHEGRRLAADQPPVRVRLLPGAGRTAVGPLRDAITRDLVVQIRSLLADAPALTPRDAGPPRPPRPVRPGDLAVVVRTNAQLDLVHTALVAAGVPSVRRATASVFGTASADDWTVLLEALEQPHRTGRLRRLALTPFVGWDAARLDAADTSGDRGELDELRVRLRRWVRVRDEHGVAALFEAVSRDQQLAQRLLALVDGERRLTDLRHVAEALHTAAGAGQLGLTATLAWLRHRIDDAERDSDLERSRRLDSDAAAVQIMTVWGSKGLEFPVVYAPFLWDRHLPDETIPLFHDPETSARTRNVGGPGGPGFTPDAGRARRELLGEDLRLLYVALTRAQTQVVAWWAPSGRNTPSAPLHRLLFTVDPAAGIPDRVPVPADAVALRRAGQLARPGALAIEAVEPDARPAPGWTDARPVEGDLALARLTRDLDPTWRRTSFTALTRIAYAVAHPGGTVASEPDVDAKDDEVAVAAPPVGAAGRTSDAVLATAALPSPMAALPGGTTLGTVVHAVLEDFDPAGGDPAAALREAVGRHGARLGPDSAVDPADGADEGNEQLAAALLAAVTTGLGPLAGHRALADFPAADRLAELTFELPLAGGDAPARPGRTRASRVSALANAMRAHLSPHDPLAGYADALTDPLVGDTVLRGYLTGSIDAVLRVDGRYVVVDHKTNRLGVPGRPLTLGDYRPEALVDAMIGSHYPLQALLYEVALHRFLRWRVPDYDPARHLGGVLYLFLRGLPGPDVRWPDGTVPGVFSWSPPAGLVEAASEVLAGRADPDATPSTERGGR